jgi:hypothetical protein
MDFFRLPLPHGSVTPPLLCRSTMQILIGRAQLERGEQQLLHQKGLLQDGGIVITAYLSMLDMLEVKAVEKVVTRLLAGEGVKCRGIG